MRRGLACWATPRGEVATWRSMVTALKVLSGVTASTTAASPSSPTHTFQPRERLTTAHALWDLLSAHREDLLTERFLTTLMIAWA
ncbi:hypothetical protein [Streptomyces sp. V4I2]|uniref:hypothetical protein n=1 Tax=Streptomyces sp. V4I2 TaxID=3042280 RepID=UPI00278428E1|nr:hypothetical protein [Streptomyces sp. V4I2]MDQ1042989.1 hypothetical protein [Streptomyces sp. V4I2]